MAFQFIERLISASPQTDGGDDESVSVFIVGINISISVTGEMLVDPAQYSLGLSNIVFVLCLVIQQLAVSYLFHNL